MKNKKSDVLQTILILLAIVGSIVIIKPVILTIAGIDDFSLFNLGSAITQIAVHQLLMVIVQVLVVVVIKLKVFKMSR